MGDNISGGKMEKRIKIAIWGVGRRTTRYMDFDYFKGCEVVFFVDTYNYHNVFCGRQVISPYEMAKREKEIDYLIVSSVYFSEIISMCLDLGIDRKKVIYSDYIAETLACQDLQTIFKISPKLYKDIRMRTYRFMKQNERDEFDTTRLVGSEDFCDPEYIGDYFRYRTFEFVAEELINNGIQGEIAELGVFRGTFSALMNKKFEKRELYLFDTFEGFDNEESSRERKAGRSDEEFEYIHKLTSLDTLMTNLPYPQMCHVYKGFFPETVTDNIRELQFAFVSIDVDFEDSIYEGLDFFYPRLSSGGYIFLHDYNSQNLSGVKNAVKRYENNIGERIAKVPLADRAGTLVITKNGVLK